MKKAKQVNVDTRAANKCNYIVVVVVVLKYLEKCVGDQRKHKTRTQK